MWLSSPSRHDLTMSSDIFYRYVATPQENEQRMDKWKERRTTQCVILWLWQQVATMGQMLHGLELRLRYIMSGAATVGALAADSVQNYMIGELSFIHSFIRSFFLSFFPRGPAGLKHQTILKL